MESGKNGQGIKGGRDTEQQERNQRENEPGFDESLTVFERLEMALDNWLSADTGEHTESLLQASAIDAANWINGLLEQEKEGSRNHGQEGSQGTDKQH